MWVWMLFSTFLILILLLIRQRWKVASEWLSMENKLSEEEFERWKKEKEKNAENWSEHMKKFEAGFLFLCSAAMIFIWYHI